MKHNRSKIIISTAIFCIVLIIFWLYTFFTSNTADLSSYDTAGIVQIAYSDITSVCDIEEHAAEAVNILTSAQGSDQILLSYVIDSAIQIEKSELGKYSNVVIVNQPWIERFDDLSKLKPIDFSEIPSGLQVFLNAHFQIWLVEGAVENGMISFYEYEGSGLLSLPANVGPHAPAIIAKNPLVIMINEPVSVTNPSGFLLPLTSSGNLLFTDREHLEAQIDSSNVGQFIARIEDLKLN